MSDANKFEFDPVPLGAMPSRNFTDLLPPPKPAMPVEPRTMAAKPSEPVTAMREIVIDNAPKPAMPGKMAWVPEAMKALLRPTKSKGVMAAGLASLACGIGVAQYMWPTPPAKTPEVVKVEPAPLPVAPQPVVVIPDVPVRLEPPEPVKLAPPTISVETKAPEPLKLTAPSIPDIHVKPAAGTDPPPPALILPEMPKPTAPAIKPTIEATAPPPITLPTTPPPVPTITLPDTKPATPPAIALPETKPTPPPPITLPDVKPVTVAPPPITLPDVKPTAPPSVTLPDVKPVAVAPPPLIGLPEENPKTAVPQKHSPGTAADGHLISRHPATPKNTEVPPVISAEPTFVPTGQAKPAALPEPVKPASAIAPREDYDVDVHYAASGDTWLSISKQHLGDDRYADALRAYNSGRNLAANQPVDVPPIHVLRKQYAAMIAAPKAVPQDLPKTVNGSRMYEVPSGGMSLKEIARKAFDDENYWGKVWEMNPKLRADEVVPAGTKVKLPGEAKIGE